MEFNKIRKQVLKESENRKNNTIFYIKNGYCKTWAQESQIKSDKGLRKYLTALRWEQYKNGTIDRKKAVELATKRFLKELEKTTAEKIAKIEAIENATDLDFLSISVDWVKNSYWGYNPHVEARSNAGYTTGTASGCGYDKESAGIADALNKNLSVLKVLYTLKEKNLNRENSKDDSNAKTCGYGAGYGAMPYFEGGVGASCFVSIFKKAGFNVLENHGKHSDYYNVYAK